MSASMIPTKAPDVQKDIPPFPQVKKSNKFESEEKPILEEDSSPSQSSLNSSYKRQLFPGTSPLKSEFSESESSQASFFKDPVITPKEEAKQKPKIAEIIEIEKPVDPISKFKEEPLSLSRPQSSQNQRLEGDVQMLPEIR